MGKLRCYPYFPFDHSNNKLVYCFSRNLSVHDLKVEPRNCLQTDTVHLLETLKFCLELTDAN